MDYKELIDQAYLKYIEGNYSYALFDVNMRIKWERLCLDQQGFLPEARKQIPQVWRNSLRRANDLTLNFLDCSREMAV